MADKYMNDADDELFLAIDMDQVKPARKSSTVLPPSAEDDLLLWDIMRQLQQLRSSGANMDIVHHNYRQVFDNPTGLTYTSVKDQTGPFFNLKQ